MASPYDQQQEKPLPGASPPQPEPERRRECLPERYQDLLIKMLTIFIIAGVVLAVVLWEVLNSHRMTIYVDSASLTTFNLTATGTLKHNFSAELSIRNPNRWVGIYYDRLQADGYYGGEYWFQWQELPTFYQRHKTTKVLKVVLAGETPAVKLGVPAMDLYKKQRMEGTFDLELRLNGRVRYREASKAKRSVKLRFKCWLPGLRLGGAGGFVQTKCN